MYLIEIELVEKYPKIDNFELLSSKSFDTAIVKIRMPAVMILKITYFISVIKKR